MRVKDLVKTLGKIMTICLALYKYATTINVVSSTHRVCSHGAAIVRIRHSHTCSYMYNIVKCPIVGYCVTDHDLYDRKS